MATYIYGSTLVQVMACCLTAPSLYLNQCWLFINEGLLHSPETNFTVNSHDTILCKEFQNYTFKIIVTYPRGRWVNNLLVCCLIIRHYPSFWHEIWYENVLFVKCPPCYIHVHPDIWWFLYRKGRFSKKTYFSWNYFLLVNLCLSGPRLVTHEMVKRMSYL